MRPPLPYDGLRSRLKQSAGLTSLRASHRRIPVRQIGSLSTLSTQTHRGQMLGGIAGLEGEAGMDGAGSDALAHVYFVRFAGMIDRVPTPTGGA